MYRVLIVIFTLVIMLTGCSSNDEELLKVIEEKNSEIEELQMTIERVTYEYEDNLNTKETQMLKLETEIVDAKKTFDEHEKEYSSRIVELEEELALVHKREDISSGYNMVTGYHNGRIGMGYNPDYISLYSNLMIVGYGEFELDKHKVLDLSEENTATLMIDIAGELYDFRLGYIEWDSEYKEFTMSELVYGTDKISNTSLLFNSGLAEGIPGEAILWTDETGKEFSYLIGDNSLRGDTFPYIIISELLE